MGTENYFTSDSDSSSSDSEDDSQPAQKRLRTTSARCKTTNHASLLFRACDAVLQAVAPRRDMLPADASAVYKELLHLRAIAQPAGSFTNEWLKWQRRVYVYAASCLCNRII